MTAAASMARRAIRKSSFSRTSTATRSSSPSMTLPPYSKHPFEVTLRRPNDKFQRCDS